MSEQRSERKNQIQRIVVYNLDLSMGTNLFMIFKRLTRFAFLHSA